MSCLRQAGPRCLGCYVLNGGAQKCVARTKDRLASGVGMCGNSNGLVTACANLNCSARRELRRIRHTDLTRTQYREAGNLLGTIATRMIRELRFHHAILKAEQEPQLFRLKVRFVAPSAHHVHRSERRQLTGHYDDEAERKAVKQDPAHRAEIESLLELTNSIEDLVSMRSMLRSVPLNAFFLGINRRLAV